MTMFYFSLFCFSRFISKTVESLTVQDACPSPASAPAAAHVCCGEWPLSLRCPCMKQPDEAEPGIHVFVFRVIAFWFEYDMVSFPGAGVARTRDAESAARRACWLRSHAVHSPGVEHGAVSSKGSILSIPMCWPKTGPQGQLCTVSIQMRSTSSL